MSKVELIMPKMGESIMEATILGWRKKVGDRIELDEPLLDIATDKVDSEVPSPVAGILAEILFEKDAVVPIGKAIALISTGNEPVLVDSVSKKVENTPTPTVSNAPNVKAAPQPTTEKATETDRFYSPLVKTIAKTENISRAELNSLSGSGLGGRVTKSDLLSHLEKRTNNFDNPYPTPIEKPVIVAAPISIVSSAPTNGSISGNVEIIEMDRMRKLIADHMVMSKHTSPHVTSFVEADVTNLVNWRSRVKGEFQKKYGENITFTPIFLEAVARAIRDFPLINSSVDGTKIIVKKDINLGMAAALPSGNLIVPVIKGADQLNLAGLAKQVNDLAARARAGKLKPDETQAGTFTVTNVGTFGNVMGTPIINQPQVAIMAVGAIRKKPAVLETEFGDVIAIRQMMFISLSYDHRVVDGMLGGSFLRRFADYLEQFDPKRAV
jgi:2-oxoglutarate dehydrogenase E2 component (dihydrolipoamide succinyltransferase)